MCIRDRPHSAALETDGWQRPRAVQGRRARSEERAAGRPLDGPVIDLEEQSAKPPASERSENSPGASLRPCPLSPQRISGALKEPTQTRAAQVTGWSEGPPQRAPCMPSPLFSSCTLHACPRRRLESCGAVLATGPFPEGRTQPTEPQVQISATGVPWALTTRRVHPL